MVSSLFLATFALAASAAMAFPQNHASVYGRHRYHGTGHHRHHTSNSTGTRSTLWVTVTVTDDAGSAYATAVPAISTANAVYDKGSCKGNNTKTITSVTTVYLTLTPDTNTSTTTSEIDTTTTITSTSTILTTIWPTSTSDTVIETTTTTVETTTTTDATTADAVTQTTDVATTDASTYDAGAGQFFNQATTLSTYVQTTATTDAVAAPSYTAASSSSGSKKGLSYNNVNFLSQFSNSGASWAYNWGCDDHSTVPSGIEYIPMYWGRSSTCTPKDYSPRTVLSFNEPDNDGQSSIDPNTAYSLHTSNVVSAWSGKAKIGSPAVTNSVQSGQGLQWMKSFLQLCKPDPNGEDACKLDFLAIHWYNGPDQMDDFKNHVNGAIDLANQYNIPGGVWITEFAATTQDSSEQVAFLNSAMAWLESSEAAQVAKYAYFMAGSSSGFGMITDSVINAIGQAYDAIV